MKNISVPKTKTMGYGPSNYTKGAGWCWRNEHGLEQRMSPYFQTEEDCDEFHEYFTEHYREYPSLLNIAMSAMCRPDLRIYDLPVVNKIAKAFEQHVRKSVVNWIDDTNDPWLSHAPDDGVDNDDDETDEQGK